MERDAAKMQPTLQTGNPQMPSLHTPPLLLLSVLLVGGACADIASAQQTTFEFTNSGQALGNSNSRSVALGDLDGDGDLDAMVANSGQPNTVWFKRPRCTADMTLDGDVNGADVAVLLSRWGTSSSLADLNSDGVVNGADLTVLLSKWGIICE